MKLTPKKILIIATRQIGDVLITTPLIRRTRQIWPEAVIDVLGYENTMGMLSGNPDIQTVIESSEHPKWREYKELIKKLFRKYDLAIVSQPSDRAHIYGLIFASKRIGIVPPELAHNWWKRLLCQRSITLNYMSQHVVHERFALLAPFDSNLSTHPEVCPPGSVKLPPEIQHRLEHIYVVIHATPMWRFKRWRTDGWAELIRLLITKKIQVVLTGSNSQQDQDINKEIRKKIASESENVSTRQLLDLSGKLRLSHTTTLLQGAIGYIGVDTSITHLAASCGTKTLAIFGATPPTNFGPWPRAFQGQQPWKTVGASEASGLRVQTLDNVRIIQGPGTCVPCRKSGCLNKFDSHSDCLENLTAEHLAPLVLTHFNLDAHSS